jgi:hypothetical protein
MVRGFKGRVLSEEGPLTASILAQVPVLFPHLPTLLTLLYPSVALQALMWHTVSSKAVRSREPLQGQDSLGWDCLQSQSTGATGVGPSL